MMCCNGEGCACRATCLRYINRATAELVSRVLCRPGTYGWMVKA